MSYHFNSPRYVTRGIEAELHPVLQLLLWDMIRRKHQELKELDYLQVFELTLEEAEEGVCQKITHRQEIPPFSYDCYAIVDQPVKAKIFIIDDLSHVTMLLAEEY